MPKQKTEFSVTELDWLKVHLRVAALEQGGQRLSYRFEFPDDSTRELKCHIYFKDDDLNSIKAEPDSGRKEIFDGWISIAEQIMRTALEMAHLPGNFHWRPTVKYILYEGYGMGGSILHTVEQTFSAS